MKRVRGEALQPGDIILTTTTAKVSKAIKIATRSDISHAIVCVQSHSVIDATAEGVQARNVQRMFFEDKCSVYVLRYRGGLTPQQSTAIVIFVRSKIATEYSTREAVGSVTGRTKQWTAKQFCSRLVAQAYASAGIRLVPDENYCSPASIKSSALLEEVPNAVEAVSKKEVARWEARPDLTEIMRKATNALFEGIRKKVPAIQTFEDLGQHLIAHPEDDAYMAGVLEASGYLTVWTAEIMQNPWHYDLALMDQVPEPVLEAYCNSTLNDEAQGLNRYVINRGQYARLSQLTGYRTFALLADLFEKLASLHRQRVMAAEAWLSIKHKRLVAKAEPIRPHTPEWFASLELWDPLKAAATRTVIQVEGRAEVCSICGDDPAADYGLAEADRAAGGPSTLRLCDDCLVIRRGMGERYEPLDG
jgi:hypothetical protein